MSAEQDIARYNHRIRPGQHANYEHVCACCGVALEGSPHKAEQRISGWPVCVECFLRD